jgi:phosphate transport system permease protein
MPSTSSANTGSSTNDRRSLQSGRRQLPAADRRDIGIKSRRAAEKRFRAYGLIAITLGLLFLVILLVSIFSKGYTAFFQTMITVPVEFSQKVIDPRATSGPKIRSPGDHRQLSEPGARCGGQGCRHRHLRQGGARQAQGLCLRQRPRPVARSSSLPIPTLIGQTIPVTFLASANIDSAYKGQIDLNVPEADRKISDVQVKVMNEARQERRACGALQPGPVHQRRIEPSGSGRSRRGHHRFDLHDADRAGAGPADRCLRLDLS